MSKDGLLAGSGATRLLITHELFLLPQLDAILVLHEGRRAALEAFPALTALAAASPVLAQALQGQPDPDPAAWLEDSKTAGSPAGQPLLLPPPPEQADQHKIIRDEERATGAVTAAVLNGLLASGGWGNAAWVGVLFCGAEALSIVATFHFGQWARLPPAADADPLRRALQGRLAWLVALVLVLGGLRLVTLFRFFTASSRSLHGAMFQRVMHAPVAFFQANPVGRILNRFAKDMQVIDDDKEEEEVSAWR
jgi:ABC-type multidrug transport system fused ATPase/permease subunit